jgi:hypothetical protein
VTTFVQQIDAQGPAVVERITTQFSGLTCTPENARLLVEGLRNGTSVTLTSSEGGKTATFTPTGNLGYGEAYIALALAAEALRNAGVTGCATPDQWKAVLLGGPLSASGSSSTATSSSASSSSSSNFPGILALRSQGQGWGQIAKTTNVQLGQVMSSVRSSMNSNNGSSDSTLSPTGRLSTEPSSGASRGTSGTGSNNGRALGHGPDDENNTGKAKGKSWSDADRSGDDKSPASPSSSSSSSSSSNASQPSR